MKTKSGSTWTPERRAKFNSTWRSKKLARDKAERQLRRDLDRRLTMNSQHAHLTKDQIEYLETIGYETILAALDIAAGKEDYLPDPRGFFNACPMCFYDLRPHFLAAGFKKQQPPTSYEPQAQ